MRAYIVNQETKSIFSVPDEKQVFFSSDEFVEKIVRGNCCFICGAEPSSKHFNDEHVIPNWVLRECNMHNHQIKLPNDTYIRYGLYTVPCCKECNDQLGITYEIPISELFKKGIADMIAELEKDEKLQQKLFTWMLLLYFKTHLKDTWLLMERDRRKQYGKIGDYYDWHQFHHIHCMARVHYTDAIVDKKAYGSLFILPTVKSAEEFDYMDSLGAFTVLIRVGRIAVIAVLNDCKVAQIALNDMVDKIKGPLSTLQLKEMFAHATYINNSLKERPAFNSTVAGKGYEIIADFPEQYEILPPDENRPSVAEILHHYASMVIPENVTQREWILDEIKNGRMRYLFNQDNEFVQYPDEV